MIQVELVVCDDLVKLILGDFLPRMCDSFAAEFEAKEVADEARYDWYRKTKEDSD